MRFRTLKPPFKRAGKKGWWIDYRMNGARHRKCFPNRELALRVVREVQEDHVQSKVRSIHVESVHQDARISDLVGDLIRQLKSGRYSTYKHYEFNLNKFLFFLSRHPSVQYLSHVNPSIIREFADWILEGGLGYVPKKNTVKGLMLTVSKLFSEAIRLNRYAGRNPVKAVFKEVIKVIPDDQRQIHVFTREELSRLLQAAQEPYKSLFLIYVYTGLRRSELINVKREDVDLTHQFLAVQSRPGRPTKTGRDRRVWFSDQLLPVLKRYLEKVSQEYPFTHDWTGHGIDRTKLHRRFKIALKAAGISDPNGIHFHDLRHTYATFLVEADVPLPAIKELLGHRNIQSTMIYAHSRDDYLQRIVQRLAI